MSAFELDGACVVVTGAGNGIGAALATALAARSRDRLYDFPEESPFIG